MNCLDVRRAVLTNPRHPGPKVLDHAAACPECARFLKGVQEQEELLYRVLAVPVPEGLADRVLWRTRPRLALRSPRLWLPALAAALVLALGLSLWAPRGLSPEALAAGVIDHVRAEPQALAAEQAIPRSALVSVFARNGVDLLGDPVPASYAGRCPLPGGGQGEHIVLKTPQGKVTLILMPDKPVAAALRLFKNGLNVSVLPAGGGSLALVAESDALVRATETALLANLRWRNRRI